MRHAQVIFVPPWLPRLDSGESNREFFLVFVFLGTGEGAVCTFVCLCFLLKREDITAPFLHRHTRSSPLPAATWAHNAAG